MKRLFVRITITRIWARHFLGDANQMEWRLLLRTILRCLGWGYMPRRPPPCVNQEYFTLYEGVCIGVVTLFAVTIYGFMMIEILRRDRSFLLSDMWIRWWNANFWDNQIEGDVEYEQLNNRQCVIANRRLRRQLIWAMNKYGTGSTRKYFVPSDACEAISTMLLRKAHKLSQLAERLNQKTELERSLTATRERSEQVLREVRITWYRWQVALRRIAQAESKLLWRKDAVSGDRVVDDT